LLPCVLSATRWIGTSFRWVYSKVLLFLETYQATENSTYPVYINTFGAEDFPVMDPAFLPLFYP
jgi:hypothetical protein